MFPNALALGDTQMKSRIEDIIIKTAKVAVGAAAILLVEILASIGILLAVGGSYV
jgi:hypothetical protein